MRIPIQNIKINKKNVGLVRQYFELLKKVILANHDEELVEHFEYWWKKTFGKVSVG